MLASKSAIIFLMGPTASGKTALAIELTQRLPCEIISVDSGMVYREMDIGTAKPTCEEQAIAPHHLIDICYPWESYSAGRFRQDALGIIEEILARGKIPLLVGGTMLYFRVLEQGIANLPQSNPEIRAAITAAAEQNGWEFLHKKLQVIDPIAAARISRNDSQRIQRALELYELTGKNITALHQQEVAAPFPYQVLNLGLIPEDRERFQAKINTRFQQMLKLGFVEEVEKLFLHEEMRADLPSMRAVGYRQVWQYLSGEIKREEMLERIPIVTRQLAKRQLTWMRSWPGLSWVNTDDSKLIDKVIAKITQYLN